MLQRRYLNMSASDERMAPAGAMAWKVQGSVGLPSRVVTAASCGCSAGVVTVDVFRSSGAARARDLAAASRRNTGPVGKRVAEQVDAEI